MTESEQQETFKNIPTAITCPSIVGNYGEDGCWYPELTPPPTPTTESITSFPFPINTTTASEPLTPNTEVTEAIPVRPTPFPLEYGIPPAPIGIPFPSNYYVITPPPPPFIHHFIPPMAPVGFIPPIPAWQGYPMPYVPPPYVVDPIEHIPQEYDGHSCYPSLDFTENDEVYDLYGSFKGTKLPTSRPILLTAKPSKYSAGIEAVWRKHFQIIFKSFPDAWVFGKTEEPLSSWEVFSDNAKVRFCCKNCNHGWTSMHGSVLFYYRREYYGDVRFRLTGQKCDDCDDPSFQSPAWYPEEAQKVMNNLGNEIASRVYGIPTAPKSKDRRYGRPSKQHNSSGCESCHLGICHVGRKSTTPTEDGGSSHGNPDDAEDLCNDLEDMHLSCEEAASS